MTFFSHAHMGRGNQHFVTVKASFGFQGRELKPLPQAPALTVEPEIEGETLVQDTDIFPKLHFTDFILKGQAFAPEGRPTQQLDVALQIDRYSRVLRVTGQRFVQLLNQEVRFSQPEPFEAVPLTWQEAYGGVDTFGAELGDRADLPKLSEAMGRDLSHLNLNRYPRNPMGKGYVLQLTPEHDGWPLPRVEWKHHLLTPEILETRELVDWHFKPSPACLEWVNYTQFPRSALWGGRLLGFHQPMVPQGPLPEQEFGLQRSELLDPCEPIELAQHPRVCNGAHPALQLPDIRGRCQVRVTHMHPQVPDAAFELPLDPPEAFVKPPGASRKKGKASLSTVVMDMNQGIITCTWHVRVVHDTPVMPDRLPKLEYEVVWAGQKAQGHGPEPEQDPQSGQG